MAGVETVVGKHFPELLNPLKAALGVIAAGSIADNQQPTTLIFVGPSSVGKTLVLTLILPGSQPPQNPEPPNLWAYLLRSDKFTTASFVSHRADVKKKDLEAIDLLPKLKGKTLITKELAPVFTGKREDLMERFAMLTTILDGQGLVSHSGAHGEHGYAEPINFQWLGATTPLTPTVLAVMGQLGPRMLFYEVDRPSKDTDALVAQLGAPPDKAVDECRDAVSKLLEAFFEAHPPGSVGAHALPEIPEPQTRRLAIWAQAVVKLRASIEEDVPSKEHPERAMGILRNFVLGSALMAGRGAVSDEDLAQVAHIAMSSGVWGRGRVLRALLDRGGQGSTPALTAATGLSAPTVLRYMEELGRVGIAKFTKGEGASPGHAELAPPFTELCAAPLLPLEAGGFV